MKRIILLSAITLFGCHKAAKMTIIYPNKPSGQNAGVSAANGCVTCHTTYYIEEYANNNNMLLFGQSDSTICNVSDSALAAYINKYTYSGKPIGVLTDPKNTEVIETLCH